MSYAYPFRRQPSSVIILVAPNDTGVGDESKAITETSTNSLEHYLLPYSRLWDTPELRFQMLAKEWKDDTVFMSSLTDIAMHPAYQQIIGVGPIAIPFILAEMEKENEYWFWALKAITGEDPTSPEDRGNLKAMTESWLRWGREHKYS